MSITQKTHNTQVFRLMVYARALHPELFELQARRNHRQNEYEVETWMIPAGHVLRFHAAGQCLTETVIEGGDHLPESGLIHALPCLGEKEYDMEREDPKRDLGYVTTIQTEQLTDNLYQATYREMLDFAHETHALKNTWQDADNVPCLSVLDAQNYKREYHLQAYHLLGASGVVLRTQSIFEIPTAGA